MFTNFLSPEHVQYGLRGLLELILLMEVLVRDTRHVYWLPRTSSDVVHDCSVQLLISTGCKNSTIETIAERTPHCCPPQLQTMPHTERTFGVDDFL